MSLIVVLTALPARSFAIPFLEVIAQWTIAVICSVTVSSGRGSAQAGDPDAVGDLYRVLAVLPVVIAATLVATHLGHA